MWIDWQAIASQQSLRRMAAVLRQDWGVWVGLIDLDGHAVPLASTDVTLRRPACALLEANALTDDQPGPKTCRSAMQRWHDADAPREGRQPGSCAVECHAKLGALVCPIKHRERRVATLYASGFLRASSAERDTQALRDAVSRAGHSAPPDSWFEVVPRLTAQDEQVLRRLLRALAAEAEALLEHHLDKNPHEGAASYEKMLGKSPKMLKMFSFIERVARSRSTVLILGENGTGKELVAQALHQRSTRADQPFLGQNCAAIPPDLIESELFGHKKGAFSGASRDREGLFSAADHGTFFLDEIGEMTLAMQAKLLRVLQEGTFLPVGDTAYRKVDVRIICATNRDLRAMVKQKTFREDLFYRINVITIEVPALRERLDDLELLTDHFLANASREHGLGSKYLDDETLELMRRHTWPGNVRELRHELERMAILSGAQERITPELLSARILPAPDAADDELGSLRSLLDEKLTLPEAVDKLERAMIARSLERARGNKSRAARDLGVSRRNLIRKVAAYGWGREEDDEEQEDD
jgi:DNA-binding NtrC family response regulator